MIKSIVNLTLKAFKSNCGRDDIITLPFEIYRQVKEDFKITLKVGMIEKKVQCYVNNTSDHIELPNKLLEHLGLVANKVVNLMIKEEKICIGPVIGIFVSNGEVEKANLQNPNFRWIETMKANKEVNAIVYFFSVKDVDFTQNKIIGSYFNEEDNLWEQKYFPYPDVLYDRGGGKVKTQKTISDYIRKELSLSGKLMKINSNYSFDKWEIHEKLLKYKK